MKKNSVLIIIIFLFCGLSAAQETPLLEAKDLEKYTYYFDVADSKLTGSGAKFLTDADFYGNKAVNINFSTRFYIDDKSAEVDALADEKGWLYNFRSLLQMAKKDQWTIIDLRPLRETVFYQNKFNLTGQM